MAFSAREGDPGDGLRADREVRDRQQVGVTQDRAPLREGHSGWRRAASASRRSERSWRWDPPPAGARPSAPRCRRPRCYGLRVPLTGSR